MRVTVIGFVSRDRNILPSGQVVETVGGKGFYAAAALSRGGIETDLITWLPSADAKLLLTLQDYPLGIHVISVPTGTVNSNVHRGDQVEATTHFDSKVFSPADFNAGMRQAIEASDQVVLAPSAWQQISSELLDYFSNTIGVSLVGDLGNALRAASAEGRLAPRDPWPEQEQYLRPMTTVAVSAEEVAIPLQRGESFLSLARAFSEQGPNEVIITAGSRGSFIYQAETNEGYDLPAYPPTKLVDPTGAGDTYLGAYLAERSRTDNVLRAGKFAAMAASLKLAYTGPLREPGEQVDRALAEVESSPGAAS
ncbi:MAG: carbohydrate kinase family protein [Candidatus Kerfeldbacteria bacterium]|nr:carbohydrate kinase family protein [Candidatus Kerfeldbacteria bacterium]